VLSTGTAHAFDIAPGLWVYDISSTNAFTGTQQFTNEQCVTESEFDPEQLRQGMGDCEDLRFEDSGDAVEWTFTCSNRGMKGTGTGSVRMEGADMLGEMRLVMSMASMGGGDFVIDNEWTARRVGDCG
jgi:hypothetical protein